MLQKTLNKPEFELIKEDEIDEDEDMSYYILLFISFLLYYKIYNLK